MLGTGESHTPFESGAYTAALVGLLQEASDNRFVRVEEEK